MKRSWNAKNNAQLFELKLLQELYWCFLSSESTKDFGRRRKKEFPLKTIFTKPRARCQRPECTTFTLASHRTNERWRPLGRDAFRNDQESNAKTGKQKCWRFLAAVNMQNKISFQRKRQDLFYYTCCFIVFFRPTTLSRVARKLRFILPPPLKARLGDRVASVATLPGRSSAVMKDLRRTEQPIVDMLVTAVEDIIPGGECTIFLIPILFRLSHFTLCNLNLVSSMFNIQT